MKKWSTFHPGRENGREFQGSPKCQKSPFNSATACNQHITPSHEGSWALTWGQEIWLQTEALPLPPGVTWMRTLFLDLEFPTWAMSRLDPLSPEIPPSSHTLCDMENTMSPVLYGHRCPSSPIKYLWYQQAFTQCLLCARQYPESFINWFFSSSRQQS